MSVKMLANKPDDRNSITVRSDPTRIDPLKLKLGKHPPRHDPRTLLFATYATAALPAPPPTLNLTTKVKVPWGMMDNARSATAPAPPPDISSWSGPPTLNP